MTIQVPCLMFEFQFWQRERVFLLNFLFCQAFVVAWASNTHNQKCVFRLFSTFYEKRHVFSSFMLWFCMCVNFISLTNKTFPKNCCSLIILYVCKENIIALTLFWTLGPYSQENKRILWNFVNERQEIRHQTSKYSLHSPQFTFYRSIFLSFLYDDRHNLFLLPFFSHNTHKAGEVSISTMPMLNCDRVSCNKIKWNMIQSSREVSPLLLRPYIWIIIYI